MARDHYIPAAVIGRFSADGSSSARDRFVYAARKGGKAFRVRAGQFGYVNGLYDVKRQVAWKPGSDESLTSVDSLINGYESKLPESLDLLDQAEPMGLSPWLRTLVPFVAGMFVRGAEFPRRFESRPVVKYSGVSSRDNSNGARLIELQRLLSPVMSARWVVLHHSALEPFILNDLGMMTTRDIILDEWGFAIPIGMNAVLGIFPRDARTIAQYRNGVWHPVIEHRILDGREVFDFNRAMAASATEWILGSSNSTVERYIKFINIEGHDTADVLERWPFNHRTRVAHDREWHRMAGLAEENPRPDQILDLQTVNIPALGNGWCPPLVWTINMREMPTGLRLSGTSIRLTMKEPHDYDSYFISAEDLA